MTTEAVRCEDVEAGFGGRSILHGVSVVGRPGEVVAVLGLNGAGKSVLGRTISGLVRITRGSVSLRGTDVTASSPRRRVRLGLHHLSQTRGLVPELSVLDNVRLAAFGAGQLVTEAAVRDLPTLGPWADQRAGTLSGGEQALVALARAQLLAPAVLIADEPTAGLAPAATERHSAALRAMADDGVCVLLIEQSVAFALGVADRVVVLRNGAVALDAARIDVDDGLLRRALVG